MGLPAYLLGLSIPLVGACALAIFMVRMMQQNESQTFEYAYTANKGYNAYNKTRKRIIETICTICCEEFALGHTLTLECGHTFHTECKDELIANNLRKCPNCRAEIS